MADKQTQLLQTARPLGQVGGGKRGKGHAAAAGSPSPDHCSCRSCSEDGVAAAAGEEAAETSHWVAVA